MRGILDNPRVKAALAAIVALIAAVGITIAVVDEPGPSPGTHKRTVTVTLGGPGHKTIALPPAAQTELAKQKADDARGNDAAAESDLHERQPPTSSELRAAREAAPPGAPRIPQATTFASPSTAGCTSAFVRNSSPRPAGARVLLGVIHWTGSSPIPRSTSDVLAITRWFDTPAAQASSNYITDDDGHCIYTVPETRKAWTQAGANPWAVSDEHVNVGRLPVFPTAAGRNVVVRLMRGWHARWHLPYRRGAVNKATCVPTRSGFLAHRDLGPCGGGHPDIGTPSAVDALIKLAASTSSATGKPNTAAERSRCGSLAHHRRAVRHRRGKWSDTLHVHGNRTSRGRRARYLKGTLRRGHVDEARYCA